MTDFLTFDALQNHSSVSLKHGAMVSRKYQNVDEMSVQRGGNNVVDIRISSWTKGSLRNTSSPNQNAFIAFLEQIGRERGSFP